VTLPTFFLSIKWEREGVGFNFAIVLSIFKVSLVCSHLTLNQKPSSFQNEPLQIPHSKSNYFGCPLSGFCGRLPDANSFLSESVWDFSHNLSIRLYVYFSKYAHWLISRKTAKNGRLNIFSLSVLRYLVMDT